MVSIEIIMPPAERCRRLVYGRLRPRHQPDALAHLGERARGDGLGALGAGPEDLERVALVGLELADPRLDRREGLDDDLGRGRP